jgi:hypothetical protein
MPEIERWLPGVAITASLGMNIPRTVWFDRCLVAVAAQEIAGTLGSLPH